MGEEADLIAEQEGGAPPEGVLADGDGAVGNFHPADVAVPLLLGKGGNREKTEVSGKP